MCMCICMYVCAAYAQKRMCMCAPMVIIRQINKFKGICVSSKTTCNAMNVYLLQRINRRGCFYIHPSKLLANGRNVFQYFQDG